MMSDGERGSGEGPLIDCLMQNLKRARELNILVMEPGQWHGMVTWLGARQAFSGEPYIKLPARFAA
jgi:hypothetical protein